MNNLQKVLRSWFITIILAALAVTVQAQCDQLDDGAGTEVVLTQDTTPYFPVIEQSQQLPTNSGMLENTMVMLKPKPTPPPGCGTDSAGVKYCCTNWGFCYPENWEPVNPPPTPH